MEENLEEGNQSLENIDNSTNGPENAPAYEQLSTLPMIICVLWSNKVYSDMWSLLSFLGCRYVVLVREQKKNEIYTAAPFSFSHLSFVRNPLHRKIMHVDQFIF